MSSFVANTTTTTTTTTTANNNNKDINYEKVLSEISIFNNNISHWIEDDKVMIAANLMNKIRIKIKDIFPGENEEIDKFRNEIENDNFLKDINERSVKVKHLKEMFTNNDINNDWILQRDDNDIQVYYKPNNDNGNNNGTEFHTLRIEATIEDDLFEILALFYEVDLYDKWIPDFQILGIDANKVLLNPLPTKILAYFGVYLPWPMGGRELYLAIDGIDNLHHSDDDDDDDEKEKEIICLVNSVEEYPGFNIPNDDNEHEALHGDNNKKRRTRIGLPEGGIILVPGVMTAEGKCIDNKLKILFQIDPKVPYVPPFLINFVTRNVAFLLVEQIRSAMKITSTDIYQKRIHENEKFYGMLKDRLQKANIPKAF